MMFITLIYFWWTGAEVSADADISFENVAFSYPSRPNVQILDGLNVTFEAGKVTAIVGPSGSGKSTVVSTSHAEIHTFRANDNDVGFSPPTLVRLTRDYCHRSHHNSG